LSRANSSAHAELLSIDVLSGIGDGVKDDSRYHAVCLCLKQASMKQDEGWQRE
jgi:hypothetical protein